MPVLIGIIISDVIPGFLSGTVGDSTRMRRCQLPAPFYCWMNCRERVGPSAVNRGCSGLVWCDVGTNTTLGGHQGTLQSTMRVVWSVKISRHHFTLILRYLSVVQLALRLSWVSLGTQRKDLV
jgi:hypothetical protein